MFDIMKPWANLTSYGIRIKENKYFSFHPMLTVCNGQHLFVQPIQFCIFFLTKLEVMKWNSVPGSHSINYDSLHVSLSFSPTGDNSPAFINKTLQNALNAANLSPSELAKALQIEKVHIRI